LAKDPDSSLLDPAASANVRNRLGRAHPSPLEVEARRATADSVVCFGSVDWWYHPRGYNDCQSMRRIATQKTVLWINSIGMRAPSAKNTNRVFHRYWRKLKSYLRFLRRDESGMWVFTPVYIPVYSPRMVEVNGWLLMLQLRILMTFLGMQRPSLFVSVPTAAPVAERGDWVRVVYNRNDRHSAFSEADGGFIRTLEERLYKISDSAVYMSPALLEDEKHLVPETHHIGHGVNVTKYMQATPEDLPGEVREKLKALPRPIVGVHGVFDAYRFDEELLVKVARHVAPGTLLLFGLKGMDMSRLLGEPNVVFLGPVPYEQVQTYASLFDVSMLPYLRNEFIENCSPIKLKEYLALGRPVVSVRFPEVELYDGLVYTAETHEEFLSQIDRALEEDDPRLVRRRRAQVAEDSWENLTRRIAPVLGVRLPKDAFAAETPAEDGALCESALRNN
jgi:glycosyltransferase involved in cell wall biosynthesis